MEYTYKKIDNQQHLYEVNYKDIVFNIGATDESQIDELVKFHLDFLNKPAELPVITYDKQRSAEYPLIQDQLDTLYHKGYDGWKAEIQAIKDKYPKGASV